ncbi:hypothetical protein L7F22_036515 [Adiantum nelumboides]|nr:hypothetical protein [Adiantum nelumboides]
MAGGYSSKGRQLLVPVRTVPLALAQSAEENSLKDYCVSSFVLSFAYVALNAQEQQKALIRHNAELAKARLESGELQRAREEQRKMHQLYGTVDWRANKKLRTEKKILERTVAAGKRLASLEQREYARMDAFRVALGLPTAEAQRQAEWRREATQALAELENGSKPAATASNARCKKAKQGLIGPMLPP